MSDVLIYASAARADTARWVLAHACRATATNARLEIYGTGSLYQRLGPRRAQPMPDLVWWFGPFAARAAALDGLLQPHQPSQVADGAARDPDWNWTAVEYSTIGSVGDAGVGRWSDLASVPRLAMADPERSEVGMTILLASLDRARQSEGDVERGWAWWQARVAAGLVLAEDEAGALALVQSGAASHAVTLSPGATPVSGLAPIPHGVALAASSRSVDTARRVLEWLTSLEAATTAAAGSAMLSPWQAATNGLAGLWRDAPPLDVEWGRQQYAAARARWAGSGFAPTLS
jgi:ABC-type Fe3+ transport system substrate-binding protein